MEKAKFTKINEGFSCDVCGAEVPKAKSTCRDHCPFCLHSVHVDVNPGDRAESCRGILKPIAYELANKKKGLVLIYQCTVCKAIKRNRALLDDPFASDDYSVILKLSGR